MKLENPITKKEMIDLLSSVKAEILLEISKVNERIDTTNERISSLDTSLTVQINSLEDDVNRFADMVMSEFAKVHHGLAGHDRRIGVLEKIVLS